MLNEGLESLFFLAQPFLQKQERSEIFRVGVSSPLCIGFIFTWAILSRWNGSLKKIHGIIFLRRVDIRQVG